MRLGEPKRDIRNENADQANRDWKYERTPKPFQRKLGASKGETKHPWEEDNESHWTRKRDAFYVKRQPDRVTQREQRWNQQENLQ